MHRSRGMSFLAPMRRSDTYASWAKLRGGTRTVVPQSNKRSSIMGWAIQGKKSDDVCHFE